MRDARHEDAAAISEVWAAASPMPVRSAARAAADLLEDPCSAGTAGSRRCQPLIDSGSRKPVRFARTPRFHSQVSTHSTMPTASR